MRFTSWALLAVVAGCGGDDDSGGPLGGIGDPCYPDQSCDVGLTCAGGTCMSGPILVDAPTARDSAAADAAFVCNDDSAYEDNDTVGTAYQTDVAAGLLTRTFPLLAICPAGDIDHFEVSITVASQDLELLVDYVSLTPLQASILNSGGVPIANAAPVSGQPRIRAFTPNLPVGIYFVRVYLPSTQSNNYSMTVTVTP